MSSRFGGYADAGLELVSLGGMQIAKKNEANSISRGKVFVFTGILPLCRDEDGIAAVLGHEIAHVVAHHTA